MAERGGSHEQHQKAGHAGGMATKEKHGEGFYEEIGRKGGEARAGSHDSNSSERGEQKNEGSHTRGGTSEQHAAAGRQSHKND